jgi:lipid-A-disaccharide synthase-like uncharacterized protein
MPLVSTSPFSRGRALRVLGRVSNLPTVWSNCLAGWWLGGGGSLGTLLLLCLCASALYVGGMYLNDAFDVQFDRQHRRERPIPSGAVSVEEVWAWGFAWMSLGALPLMFLGFPTAAFTLLLAGSILIYDAVHKLITFSPVLMAACRFFLLLLAASIADSGVTGLAVWSAFALGAYIVGLSYIARKESVRGVVAYWPVLFLGGPILLAWFANPGDFQARALALSALLIVWIVWCLRSTFGNGPRNIGRTVSGLLAGIPLVDLLAVASGPPPLGLAFLALFGAALVFQRHIPAT